MSIEQYKYHGFILMLVFSLAGLLAIERLVLLLEDMKITLNAVIFFGKMRLQHYL